MSIKPDNLAQTATSLNLPILTANGRRRIKSLERIIFFLDRKQRIIIVAAKGLRPIWLLGIRLSVW